MSASWLSPQDVVKHGWRVSPLATAVAFSAFDREQYISAPHLKVISDAIVDAVLGQGPKFLVISMPPRHGKSWMISRWTPTWYLGNWPGDKVMICGYGSGFAKEWGRLTRNDCERHASRLGFKVAADSHAAEKWHTSEGGGLVTAGIGGGITGKGADFLIIDDPVKNADEAFSSTYREKVWNWWLTTARTRLHPGGVIVVVMTRWHDDDFAGRLLSDEFGDPTQWREIRLPAVWEENVPDIIGRTKGQALWPARYNEEYFEQFKKGSNEETWYAMYQQTPINFLGLGSVYHGYHDELNVADLERDPDLPLVWAMDFNVNPMSSVIAQYRQERTPLTLLTNELLVTAEILDELSLPNSNTPEACAEFHSRVMNYWYSGRQINLQIYADAAGGSRHTNGGPSDHQIVRDFFRNRPEYKVTFHIESSNPAVKDRTNAMNTALKTADGTRRMLINRKCKELRKDLKEVRWKKDSSGNTTSQIDKSDPKRTHMSDAAGYFIYNKFAVKATAGFKPGLIR